jgi:hypothetical protein
MYNCKVIFLKKETYFCSILGNTVTIHTVAAFFYSLLINNNTSPYRILELTPAIEVYYEVKTRSVMNCFDVPYITAYAFYCEMLRNNDC